MQTLFLEKKQTQHLLILHSFCRGTKHKCHQNMARSSGQQAERGRHAVSASKHDIATAVL